MLLNLSLLLATEGSEQKREASSGRYAALAQVNGMLVGGMLRRIVGMLAVIVGGTVCLYFAWVAHRFSGLWPKDWPQSFPYPDRWLSTLNDYYDAKYPVTGPYIKLHGEWPIVMRDVTCATWAGGIICVVGLAMLLWPMIRRMIQSHKRGFAVVVRTDGGSAAN